MDHKPFKLQIVEITASSSSEAASVSDLVSVTALVICQFIVERSAKAFSSGDYRALGHLAKPTTRGIENVPIVRFCAIWCRSEAKRFP